MIKALPEGWATASSATLFTFVTSGSRGWARYYSERGALFLRISNLDHDSISIDLSEKQFVEPPASIEGRRTCVRVGDILVSITADVGMVGLVQEDLGEAYVNQHIALARSIEGINRRYLAWYIAATDGGLAQLRELQRGATKVGLGLDDIRSIIVPVPPLPEQDRIIAKIEALLWKARRSSERLDKIPGILKRFRQAVLAAACNGTLTAEWRERNPSGETAAALIERIRQRREKGAATTAEQARIKETYLGGEVGDSESLPSGWQFVKLNKLCRSFDYGTSAKSQPTGKVPVLRMGNIQDGEIDWTDLVYTSDPDEIQSYALRPNTVLFNRTNSPELVGKTAIYRGERPAIFAGYLIRANHEPELDPEYLNFCLNTMYARDFCRSVKTDGVSQSNINAQKLGAFEVPFCSIKEQREIVRRVKGLFVLADHLQARYETAVGFVNTLTQSVLAKAFRGELVPTEAELAKAEGREYETAEQLLARISMTMPATNGTSKKYRGNGQTRTRKSTQAR